MSRKRVVVAIALVLLASCLVAHAVAAAPLVNPVVAALSSAQESQALPAIDPLALRRSEAQPTPPPGEPIGIVTYDRTTGQSRTTYYLPSANTAASGSSTGTQPPGATAPPDAATLDFSSLIHVTSPDRWPWCRNVKLFITFPAPFAGVTYEASGALVSAGLVLTAGQNVYKHIWESGSIVGGVWASSIRVIPAYHGGIAPNGESQWSGLGTFQQWTVHSNYDWDLGWIQLQRPLGYLVGWYQYAYNNDNSFFGSGTDFINPGYPSSPPTYDGREMYYQHGYYDWVYTDQVVYDGSAPEGMVGSAANFVGTSYDYVMAILSHPAEGGTAMTRLTSDKVSTLNQAIQDGLASTVDLVPLWVRLAPSTVSAGSDLSSVTWRVGNQSKGDYSDTFTAKVYLSPDKSITAADVLLATHSTTDTVNGLTSRDVTLSPGPRIPATTASGTYYIGVILQIADANTGNNTTSEWDVAPLTVVSAPSPTPTRTNTPTPTRTCTPTPTRTPTPSPTVSMWTAPDLYPIQNDDCDGNYQVQWGPVSGCNRYMLKRSAHADMSGPSQVYDGSERSVSESNRPSGTYYYQVACCAGGSCGQPSVVQSVRVYASVPGRVDLHPIDSAGCSGDYEVTWSPLADASEYFLWEADNMALSGRTLVYQGSGTSYSVHNQSPDTWYYILQARNCRGYGEWSVMRSTQVLAAPSLRAIDNDGCSGQYTVIWDRVPGDPPIGYELQWSRNPDFIGAETVYTGTAQHRNFYFMPPGSYYYRVRSTAPSCTSGWSNSSRAVVSPLLPAPTLNPINNADGDGEYQVSWTTVAATYYELRHFQQYANTEVFTVTSTAVQVRNDTPGTWYLQVRGCGACGCGYWSQTQPVLVRAVVGNVNCAWGSRDCNRCVPNVESAFASLRDHPEILGAYHDDGPKLEFNFDSGYHRHWQGMQRLTSGHGQYLVISSDDNLVGNDRYSTLAVVYMGTRNALGLRFRANRGYYDGEYELPWESDSIVKTVTVDPDYRHSGGVQALGDFLFVAGEGPIWLYDMVRPQQPVKIGSSDPQLGGRTGPVVWSGMKDASVAAAQLADGRYLLATVSVATQEVYFFLSDQPNSLLNDPYSLAFRLNNRWSKDDLVKPAGKGEFRLYQNADLVTDCQTGNLYLIGLGNACTNWQTSYFGWILDQCLDKGGTDYVDLFQVTYSGAAFGLEYVSSLHPLCHRWGDRYCQFRAASGAYVDPDGQLFLYAEDWESEDYDGQSIDEFGEFRSLPEPGEVACPTIDQAWVELYRAVGFGEESIMIDYVDRGRYNYADYDDVEDFDNRASSVRWCLPRGWSYLLYQDPDYEGHAFQLDGSGTMQQIPNLKDYNWNDRVSSSRFVQQASGTWTLPYNVPIKGTYFRAERPAAQSDVDVAAPGAAVQNGYSEIDVPAGAVDDEVTMSYVPLSPLHPTSPKLCAGWAFDLEIYDEVLQPDFHFTTPVTVTVHYVDSDVAHVQENTLKLAYWDADTERWVDAGTTCPGPTAVQHNPQENWLAAQACRAGEYALLADGPLSIYLPLVLKRGHAPEPPKLILFDETHDENASLSWERAQQITPGHPEWRYFGRLQADLADEFTLVRHTAGPLTAELLARYDALWLASPRLPFSAAELAAIAQFQQNSGGLLLLTLDQAVDSSLLTGTGITADARLLFSLDGNGDFPVTLFADILAKDVDRMQTNWGGSLVVFEPAIPLAASGKAVFQDRNDNFTYDEGEPGGPFYIAAAFESGARRLIAASTQAFQDDFYDVRNNEPFARALLRWLTATRGSQPAPTPTPSGQWWKDGFDTASLGPQWWWINPDAAQWSLTARPGFLRILDHSGPAWGKNLLVQRAPGGPFYATTRVVFQPVSNYQSAGLVISNEAGAYLTLTRGYCDAPAPACVGNGIYFDYTVDGQPVSSKYAVPSTGQGEAYLRLVGNAPTYSAYWSSDGRDWTFIGSHTMPGTGVPLIGLGVGGDLPGARIPADFDFFEVWSAIAP